MSTPITDKHKFRIGDSDHFAVHEIFVRQLETELAAEREKVAKLKDIIGRASTKFCEDGPDGEIAAEMLRILGESKYAIK